MSRPNTGSATVPVGEYGTRWIQSRIVSQVPDTAPAMPSASRTARPAITQRPTGTRSGIASGSKASAMSARGRARAAGRAERAERAANRPDPRVPLRLPLRLRDAPGDGPQAARPLGIGGRDEPVGDEQVADEDDQRAEQRRAEQAPLGAEARPEHAVEADAPVPDRVGPQVDARAEQQDDAEHDDDDRDDADTSRDGPEGRGLGAVVGTADRAGRRARGAPAPAAARAERDGLAGGWVSLVARGVRRRARLIPAPVAVAVPAVAAPGLRLPARLVALVPVARVRLAPLRLGAPTLELAHEVVEQVAHPCGV